MKKQELDLIKKVIIDRDIKDKEEYKKAYELLKVAYKKLTEMGYEFVATTYIEKEIYEKALEVLTEQKSTMKIKRFGKNKRQLKKLIESGARIFKDNIDWTQVFKAVVGYDFTFRLHSKGLEIVDCLGDTFILESEEKFEIV